MGAFIAPLRLPFSNLGNSPTTLLTANAHPLVVQSIIINNRGLEQIRVNLSVNTTQVGKPNIELFTNFIVPPSNEPLQYKATTVSNPVDLLTILGSSILLMYDTGISDNITIYSSAAPQKFNCYITYESLTQLP